MKQDKALDEIIEIVKEQNWIRQEVKSFSFIAQRYFSKRAKLYMNNIDVYDWLIYDKQMEVYSCALEDTIQFIKNKSLFDYIPFIKKW